MSRFAILFLLVAKGALAAPGDGFTEKFVEGLAHDTFSAVFGRETRGRRMQAFVDGYRAERRLDSTTDVATGQSTGSAGPTTDGVAKAVAAAQCSDASMSCVSVKMEEAKCAVFKGAVQEFVAVTNGDTCFCEDCPAGGKMVEHVTETINALTGTTCNSREECRANEVKMQMKGVDEIAGMCAHQPALQCVFGEKKAGCQGLVTAMDSMAAQQGACISSFGASPNAGSGTSTATCPKPSEVIAGVMLPSLKCLCVDCNYADFAAVISPIAKKMMTQKDIYPVMAEMSTAICQKKDTVKCFLSGKGSCAEPKAEMLGPQAAQASMMVQMQRATMFNSLDCLCTECPKTMAKAMTLAEKLDKGMAMTEAEKFQEMCAMYEDMQCFLQKDACRDATLMLMQTVGPMVGEATSSVPTDPAAFKTWAEQQSQTLKAECSKQGITVVEYEESSEASFAQGLKLGLAPAALLATYAVSV